MNESSITNIQHKIHIPENEVSFVGYNFDEIGKVFTWKNRVFRLIYPEKALVVKKLLDSGVIDELASEGLFPKTTVSQYAVGDADLILEHEKIWPIIYPDSWSFDMFKSAALCTVRVNKIARKYGYQTIDAHGFNILFRNASPMFIDLGSFIPNTENPKGWKAYEEFLKYFYYPLRVFKTGNTFIGRAILARSKSMMPHSSYYQFRYPVTRLFHQDFIDRLLGAFHKYKSFSHYSVDEINKRSPAKVRSLLLSLKKKKIAPFQTVSFNKLERKISKLKLPSYQSLWGYYHDQFVEKDGKIVSTTGRFNRIIEIINELQPKSILEVGGNQGVFSELILQNTSVKQICCTDYDEVAVNKMYNRIKFKNLNITPSLMDIVSPTSLSYGAPLEERYKSDMIIALALTHHLILTQKMPLNSLFNQFNKFTERYIITEFMPLGLYSEDSRYNEAPPEWYNEAWFQAEFEKQYALLYKETLEKNRILFVGLKK